MTTVFDPQGARLLRGTRFLRPDTTRPPPVGVPRGTVGGGFLPRAPLVVKAGPKTVKRRFQGVAVGRWSRMKRSCREVSGDAPQRPPSPPRRHLRTAFGVPTSPPRVGNLVSANRSEERYPRKCVDFQRISTHLSPKKEIEAVSSCDGAWRRTLGFWVKNRGSFSHVGSSSRLE